MTLEELKLKATASELTLIEAVEATQDDAIRKRAKEEVREITKRIETCLHRHGSNVPGMDFLVQGIKRALNPESE